MNQPKWRKSTYSGPQDNCVEVADLDPHVGIRDSKNPSGGHLSVTPAVWATFVNSLKADQLTG